MSFNDLYLAKGLIKDKICSQKTKAWAVMFAVGLFQVNSIGCSCSTET